MAEGEERPGNRGPGRPAGAVLSIRTIGRLSVCVDGKDIETIGRKSRALIGYLALSEAGEETRERLVGLLWSETEEERARASLRQALHELRGALDDAGFDGLAADKLAIRIDRSRVAVDLWHILGEAQAGRAHPLLLDSERPLERLLDDLETLDPAFRIWLLAKRQTLTERVRSLLETAMRGSATPVAEREALARALMNLDLTHEEAARVRIRARAEAGDIGVALGIYKALWDLLDAEYDVEPSKETQELIAAIKLGQPAAGVWPRVEVPDVIRGAGTAVALPEAPTPRKPWSKLMVTVAGFEVSATKPRHRYLVEGFRRELIACLVRFREWVVRDVTLSSAAAGSQARDTAEYAVEASALEAEQGALRLVITLRDLAANTFLWSEGLNVSVANWFEAHQLVVRRITTALNVHLSAERLVAVTHRPPGDLKAYDVWLLGQATFLSFNARRWEKARDLFRQVIAQAPDFAPAYSTLAQLNNTQHIAMPGIFRDSSRIAEALAYAREAARLDPLDSRSQLCLGWSHAMLRQFDQAIIFMRLACELNQNDPWTQVSSAVCLSLCGEYEQAQEIAEHILELPLAPSPMQWQYHACIRFLCSDYRGCVEATVASGYFGYAPGFSASALSHLGDRNAAVDELCRFFELVRGRWVGDEPPSEANITRWFLYIAPTKRPEDWQRLRDGLAAAGAPVEGLSYDKL